MNINGLPPVYNPIVSPNNSNSLVFPQSSGSQMKRMSPSSLDRKIKSPEEQWVEHQLPFYEDQYTLIDKFICSITTFNVGTKPPPANCAPLVTKQIVLDNPLNGSKVTSPVDLIVVGLQEVDMSATAMWKEETEAVIPWINGLCTAVGADSSGDMISPQHNYFMFPSRQLVGMFLTVFVRKAIAAHVKDFIITSLPTGAMGTIGNKGCVAFRFNLYLSSFCFVNCHLAAGQENVSKRNEDIHTILTQVDFNPPGNAIRSSSSWNGTSLSLTPQDHDLLMIFGDLNYRTDMSYQEAVHRAVGKEFGAILGKDQLLNEMRSPHTPFKGFVDHTPRSFPPTYRYDVGFNRYDTSEKRRVPSYTDRVLHWPKNRRHAGVELLRMEVRSEIVCSDHKPLICCFAIPYQKAVAEEEQAVVKSLRDMVNRHGLDKVGAAKISVSTSTLDFGRRNFSSKRLEHTLMFKNEGMCVAEIQTSRSVNNSDISKATWLRCRPMNFNILPGESIAVVVECELNRQSLSWMSTWEPFTAKPEYLLNSILIFNVQNGPMSCVECSVIVTPSVFCNSLENVVKLGNKTCIEAYSEKFNQAENESVICNNEEDALKYLIDTNRPRVPKEVWYLCDAIMRRGVGMTKDLFTTDCNRDEIAVIMNFLDNNSCPIPNNIGTPYSLAQCLLEFLKNLSEPLIPFNMYAAALNAARNGNKLSLYFVHEQLPVLNCNLFIYITSFLRRILMPPYSVKNELMPSTLSHIFSRVILFNPSSSVESTTSRKNKKFHDAKFSEERAILQQEQMDAAKFLYYFISLT